MINDRSMFFTSWPSFDEGCLDALEQFLKEHPNCRVIFIDTLAKVRKIPSNKGSIYYEDTQAISALKDIADKFHVAIVVVHHVNKKDSDDPIDLISGSNGIAGAADTLMVLKRSRKNDDATLFITGRDVEEQELAMALDKSCVWTVLGDAAEIHASRVRQDVLEAIAEAGHALGPTDIGRAIGKQPESLSKTLKRMVEAGLLKRIDGGKYIGVAKKEENPKLTKKGSNGGVKA